jgi:polyisoprenoid-binding protein YceI
VTRFAIAGERSRFRIAARSTLHPIDVETDGLQGWLELEVGDGGRLDPAVTPKGRLSLPVARLRSGNAFEDRELQRLIDARRFPTIDGELDELWTTSTPGCYGVRGDVTFRGVTRTYESALAIERPAPGELRLEGSSTFDVRDFGMEPPRILLLRVHPTVDVHVVIVAAREDD